LRAPSRDRVEARVWRRLDRVIDPHTTASVVKMGMVESVSLTWVEEGYSATILFCPDNPGCPAIDELRTMMVHQAEKARGVCRARVVVTERRGVGTDA